MTPTLDWHDSPDALPEDALALLPADDLFASPAWLRATAAHALPAGERPRLALARRDGRPLALFPLRRDARGRLHALTTPYTCLYRPLFHPDATTAERVACCAAVARRCRGGVARLDCLPEESVPALSAGARRAGLLPLGFEHFGAWCEDVSGVGRDAYLAARPGALRATLVRKERRHGAGLALRVVRGGAELEPGIAAFGRMQALGWQGPEPFPDFNPALMRELAGTGTLRLGLLLRAGEVVAAQLWVLWAGRALVLKLAHDPAHDALSPGTLLSGRMIAGLLDEGARTLDFGRGDDSYKRGWARERVARSGAAARRSAEGGWGGGGAATPWGMGEEEESKDLLFLKKKKQKDFALFVPNVGRIPSSRGKRFLLLFFKKEALACFLPQALRNITPLPSSTAQVSGPPSATPVSTPMRCGWTQGPAVGVWPCTTTSRARAAELRNGSRIQSRSARRCRRRPGRMPAWAKP